MIASGVPGRFGELLAPALAAIARSPETDQLCTALALVDGFQLDLVVCPTPRDAAALLVWLADELPKRRGHAVSFERIRPERGADGARLSPVALTESILSQLEASRPTSAPARVIAIDATGYRSDEHDAWRWLFQRFNERRNHLAAAAGAPLLWLLPPELEAAFPADAPDLWSIRSVSVRLPGGDRVVTPEVPDFSHRFEPGALERARAAVAALRLATGESDHLAWSRALRRLAEQELARGHLAEAAEILRDQLAPLRAGIRDPLELAKIDRLEAEILQTLGESASALSILRERVVPAMERHGSEYQRAMTYRALASTLFEVGDLDGALEQLRNHALPLDDQMSDEHGRAMTLDGIAEVLGVRGDLDESLRILREEVLPVFDRLGDVRSRAMTLGKIANVLSARGQLDEALRIRREEVLPVFEQIGDARSKAVVLDKIADILVARGQHDEALRIRTEEILPAFEALGDHRSRAVVLDKLVDILAAQGKLDEALRIRTDLLFERGEREEALRIWKEEALPALERMGDLRNLYVGLVSYERILLARGVTPQVLGEARECLRRAATIADQCGFPFPPGLRDELAELDQMAGKLAAGSAG